MYSSRSLRRARVISFINYKGGVGKTTTTYHVGCALAKFHGKKVLMVDIDPQTNLTFLCASVEKWESHKRTCGTIKTMYDRYNQKQAIDTKRTIWRTPISLPTRRPYQNVDLVPCDIDLLGEDIGGSSVSGTFPTLDLLRRSAEGYLHDREFLVKAIREVENDYDYVLIDCPPNLYLMTQNALLASDWYMISAIPDHLSTIGLNILNKKVGQIGSLIESAKNFCQNRNASLKIAELGGIVFVKVRVGGQVTVTSHVNHMNQVKAAYPGKCFGAYTTELIGFSEAAENSLPIWEVNTSNAKNAASKMQYEQVTVEFQRRFG